LVDTALPLFGALVNGALGRRFSKQDVATIALASTAAAFGMALWSPRNFLHLAQSHIRKFTVLGLGYQPRFAFRVTVNFAFLLDQLHW